MTNNNFISEDKKTITLPVPLGTKIYSTLTKCGDFCMFQKELFNKVFQEKVECNSLMPCHTRKRNPQEMIVTLDNLNYVLNNWNIKCFETYEEAEEAISKRVEKHIEEMKALGFKVDENGYSVIEKDIFKNG